MTDATQRYQRTARLWLALWLAMLVALLPGPQATELSGRTSLTAATPALTAHHGREFVARKDAVQIRPLLASGVIPPGVAPPVPRLGGSVAYALTEWRCPPLRLRTPCARAPPCPVLKIHPHP